MDFQDEHRLHGLSEALSLALLVAACSAQLIDLDALIIQQYGTPSPVTQAPAPAQRPSTIVPPVNPGPGAAKDLTCTTEDGQAGECVSYYQCHNSNNSVNTDGIGLINIRAGGPCPSYLDACCLVPPSGQIIEPVTLKPEPVRKGCGWRNPNGVGIRTTGETDGETKFGEFPWMCAILKQEAINDDDVNGEKLRVFVGGGSLIHPSVVLTAAHYVATAPELTVRAGEWDTQTIKEPYPYQERDISSIEVHDRFNKGNLFYDIALLFLAKPMDLTPNVQVVCLPPERPKEVALADGKCSATGWGKDKFGKGGRHQVILKKVDVPLVDQYTCEERLRGTRLGRFFKLHHMFMCAGGEPGVDVCKGDGGSPLVCPVAYENDRYVQMGIVSWGIGCGEDKIPGVYVDVAKLRDWIDGKVAVKGYDPMVYDY